MLLLLLSSALLLLLLRSSALRLCARPWVPDLQLPSCRCQSPSPVAVYCLVREQSSCVSDYATSLLSTHRA